MQLQAPLTPVRRPSVKVEVPADWATASDVCDDAALTGKPASWSSMVKDIMIPVGKMDGDSLPVSAFMDHVDGHV